MWDEGDTTLKIPFVAIGPSVKRGWVGDNPFIFLDTQKIRATGWKPALTIEQGIRRTLEAVKDVYYEAKRAGRAVGIGCGIKNSGIGNGVAEWGKCRLVVESDAPNGAAAAVVPANC